MTDALPTRPEAKPGILDIVAYKPGKSGAAGVADPVKLSANENILGCSDEAKKAIRDVIDKVALYPDGRGGILRNAISDTYGLDPHRIILGCGTDEIFQLLNQTFLQPGDNMVQGEYGFSAYAIGAAACQAEIRFAKEPNYRIDVDEILKVVDDRTRIVFIANPANPTGTFLPEEEVVRLLQSLPKSVVLVLDGAYSEFATDPDFSDGIDLARGDEFPNLVVTKTFSKMHGLATLRVGWAVAPLHISEAVDRIRLPFNTSLLGQVAAVAALADKDFQDRSLQLVTTWRPWLTQQLGGLGLEVVPSQANFILVGFPTTPGRTAQEAEDFLAAQGLIVRGVSNYGLPNHLRITIGLEEHNRGIVDTLARFMGRE